MERTGLSFFFFAPYLPSCPTRGALDGNGHWRVVLTSPPPPQKEGTFVPWLPVACVGRGSNCDIAHIIRPHMAARVHHGGIADAQHSSTVRYVRVHCRGPGRPPCGMVMGAQRPRPYGSSALQSYYSTKYEVRLGLNLGRCSPIRQSVSSAALPPADSHVQAPSSKLQAAP